MAKKKTKTTDEPSLELLRSLTLAAGPPSAEGEVRDLVREALSAVSTISFDRLGSLLCERTGTDSSPRIALDAHLDEVGFMVQSITGDGYIKFVALGSWWGHVLPAQRVEVLTDQGKIAGVIGSKPPHFLSPQQQENVLKIADLAIDIGTSSRKETIELGVQLGDPIVPHAEFIELAKPGVLSSKAFDNRAGVGVLCETMLRLSRLDHPNTVIGIGAVQEELGCRGAGTAAELAAPDIAIILEATPADDLPGINDRQAVLDRGPQVRLFDPTAVSNRKLVRLVETIARNLSIPMQLAVRTSGGTDAKAIHTSRTGVPTVVIGIPARYIHSHVSLIHWNDYSRTIDLVTAVVKKLDQETVADMIRF